MSSEPYYREYFAGDAQAYAPARSVYGDGSAAGQQQGDGQSGGPQGAATYEGRFTTSASGSVSANNNNNNVVVGVGGVVVHQSQKSGNQQQQQQQHNNNNNTTGVYGASKSGVTAAGLTVDLPSPDSGIGTEAITPRDQNNIQQVGGERRDADAIQSRCALVEYIIYMAYVLSPSRTKAVV